MSSDEKAHVALGILAKIVAAGTDPHVDLTKVERKLLDSLRTGE